LKISTSTALFARSASFRCWCFFLTLVSFSYPLCKRKKAMPNVLEQVLESVSDAGLCFKRLKIPSVYTGDVRCGG
jgi:hypothetical protein